jgi:hypothetical protein
MLLPIFKPRGADHTRKLHLSNWTRFNSQVWGVCPFRPLNDRHLRLLSLS